MATGLSAVSPGDLLDRRVEITGPVERKMVINALNANVKVFMADFEDSLAPNWEKVIDGQINLRDAVNGTISYTNEAGKIYQLQTQPGGTGLPRTRFALAREARHLGVKKPSPAACLILRSTFSTTIKTCSPKAAVPISICQKPSPRQEAAWWSEVFSFTEDRFNLPRGTIKATLLIGNPAGGIPDG